MIAKAYPTAEVEILRVGILDIPRPHIDGLSSTRLHNGDTAHFNQRECGTPILEPIRRRRLIGVQIDHVAAEIATPQAFSQVLLVLRLLDCSP